MSTFNDPNAPPQPGMGQCQVTGRWVPEDELVTLSGRRVCAEGKQVLLERLRAGEAMPGESETPTIMRRFSAMFLDNIILYVASLIVMMALAMALAITRMARMPGDNYAAAAFMAVVTTIYFIYFTGFHGWKGQTLGKRAAKIKVVNLDGSPITMRTAAIRSLVYTAPLILMILAMLFNGGPGDDSGLVTAIMLVISGSLSLAEVVLALADRDRQRALHDRLAGTRVIMVG